MSKLQTLPIDAHLDAIKACVDRQQNAVIIAAPGSGKTTRVPLAFLNHTQGKIIVCQPRRIAARSTSKYMACLNGSKPGESIGYRVRFDRKISERTQIEIVTEGVLLRQIQRDPGLAGISMVIFDEFHERSLATDLNLAMTREVQNSLRPDLSILVMSATLDPQPVADFLDARIFDVAGKAHPVEVVYDPAPNPQALINHAANTVLKTLRNQNHGHVLVFCPGIKEIGKLVKALESDSNQFDIKTLHGRLKPQEQDLAFADTGLRKVIVATNIAETSLTIDGVSAVVDMGLARQPRFDPALGLDRLETVRIDKHAADQRKGRAGRTGPGVCYRLWSTSVQNSMRPALLPELHRLDLTQSILQVRSWGSRVESFGWFEAPRKDSIEHALSVLKRLDAIDDRGMTRLGHELVRLPLHPRLASLLLGAAGTPELDEVATLVALLSGRDFVTDVMDSVGDSDFTIRYELLRAIQDGLSVPGVRRQAAREIIKARDEMLRLIDSKKPHSHSQKTSLGLGSHFLHAFPERLGVRRHMGKKRFLLASGKGAILSDDSIVTSSEFICALSLRPTRYQGHSIHMIDLAHHIDRSQLPLEESLEYEWDQNASRVQARAVHRYLDLVISSSAAACEPGAPDCTERLARAAAMTPDKAFGLVDGSAKLAFIKRYNWLQIKRPSIGLPKLDFLDAGPDVSPQLMLICDGYKSFKELKEMNLIDYIKGLIGFQGMKHLNELAPESMTLPDGSRKKLCYADDGSVILATRFERLFGLDATPTVAGQCVLLHLLAPNMRPIQMTQDLSNFWRETYPQVRKELRGRYPKHPWPDNPVDASPGLGRRKKKGAPKT